MIMIRHEDIVAVQHVHVNGGINGAVAEGKRRWPLFNGTVLLDFVERVLAVAGGCAVGRRAA